MKRSCEYTLKQQKARMVKCLIDEYYSTDGAGGSLHIVLDDYNLTDNDVKYCIKYAIDSNDYFGEIIGNLLLEFTPEERGDIAEGIYDWEV